MRDKTVIREVKEGNICPDIYGLRKRGGRRVWHGWQDINFIFVPCAAFASDMLFADLYSYCPSVSLLASLSV